MNTAKKLAQQNFTNESLFAAYCQQIDGYITLRKKNLQLISDDIFSHDELRRNLRSFLLKDYFKNVFNVIYAPIYILLIDLAFWFEESGWQKPSQWVKKLPPNWPTHMQKQLEGKILQRIFGISSSIKDSEFSKYLKKNKLIRSYQEQNSQDFDTVVLTLEGMIAKRFDHYSSRRTEKTDLSISFLSLTFGLIALGKSDWSLQELARNLATFWAKEEASSDFFLGESIGGAIYSIFPAEPNWYQNLFSFAIVFLGFTLLIQTISLLSHFLQWRSGHYKIRLNNFLDNIRPRLWAKALELIEK